MFKHFIPTYHASSIYEVPSDFYLKAGIRHILIDLDNTLASYRHRHPDRAATVLVERLVKDGYDIVIISNNKGPRVATYATELGVPYLHSAAKPFRGKLARLMAERKFDPAKTLLIGDQLLTDCLVANNLGIRMLLTEKIVKEDQWTTRFNRLLDRPIRRYLRRRGHLKEWNIAYD